LAGLPNQTVASQWRYQWSVKALSHHLRKLFRSGPRAPKTPQGMRRYEANGVDRVCPGMACDHRSETVSQGSRQIVPAAVLESENRRS